MRRGFSLIELLIVVMTIPLITVVLDRAFRDWAIEVPRGVTLMAHYACLLEVTEALRDDIDQATSVSVEGSAEDFSEDSAGDSTGTAAASVLLIEQPGRRIRYSHWDGGMRREVQGDNPDPNTLGEWDRNLPQANIAWRLWSQDGAVVAVHVTSSMTHGRLKKEKLANAHLFFIGAGASRRQHDATP